MFEFYLQGIFLETDCFDSVIKVYIWFLFIGRLSWTLHINSAQEWIIDNISIVFQWVQPHSAPSTVTLPLKIAKESNLETNTRKDSEVVVSGIYVLTHWIGISIKNLNFRSKNFWGNLSLFMQVIMKLIA